MTEIEAILKAGEERDRRHEEGVGYAYSNRMHDNRWLTAKEARVLLKDLKRYRTALRWLWNKHEGYTTYYGDVAGREMAEEALLAALKGDA